MTNALTLMLYKSFFAPLIDYCDIVYINANKTTLVKLQYIQNMACRVILKAGPRDHIKDMHTELKLDMLEDRHNMHLVTECHKNIHTSKHTPLRRFFKLNTANPNRRTRRQCKYDVQVPRVKTTSGQKAFSYIGLVTWNKLKADLKEIVKIEKFKLELKRSTNVLDNHPT